MRTLLLLISLFVSTSALSQEAKPDRRDDLLSIRQALLSGAETMAANCMADAREKIAKLTSDLDTATKATVAKDAEIAKLKAENDAAMKAAMPEVPY
jgi:hypothetical protein